MKINDATTAQGKLYPQYTEWLKIMETSTGCLAITERTDILVEGYIDCALEIYSFCVHRHIKSKSKTNEITIHKKLICKLRQFMLKLLMELQWKIVLFHF